MGSKVFGKIENQDSQMGAPGLNVQVKDSDFLFDKTLGESRTGPDGRYVIEYDPDAVKGLFGDRPDIYLVIRTADGKVLKTTKEDIRMDVGRDIEINLKIPHAALVEAGLAVREKPEWMKGLSKDDLAKFTTWTWNPGFDETDPTIVQLKSDLRNQSSVLELMKEYMDELQGNPDNNAPPFIRLAGLFELGVTPKTLKGHYYGVTVGIRSGDQPSLFAGFNNFLGLLWGAALADVSPWVGKSFSPVDDDRQRTVTVTGIRPQGPSSLGINHFNRMDLQALNQVSFQFLTWWIGLDQASPSAQLAYGHEREGGFFIAHKAPSVYHGTRRDVIRLNYRFKRLHNPPPLRWLIDEMVQVAEGLYLGQLLFATRRLQSDYDPGLPDADHHYQHFGYFLLFDETWNHEARRLLPHLEMPVTAPGLFKPQHRVQIDAPKFTAFTFDDPTPPGADNQVFDQIKNDLSSQPTILHLLKKYAGELQDGLDNQSPYFLRLKEIFHRGAPFIELRGYYRGALVTWHAEGLLRFMNVNTLHAAWMKFGRYFSTWTGKSFEDISGQKLKEITDGHEQGTVPTYWGANTQALRTPKEIFMGKLAQLADVWTEAVPTDEAREFGYDVKNFFFIARHATSVNEDHRGKTVFQLNYRWPKLRTIPPDCFCIDELVRIADGLYLGHLMYATELLKPYDPIPNPGEYQYRKFGYFLLMDEDWHRIRLDIGFDLENV